MKALRTAMACLMPFALGLALLGCDGGSVEEGAEEVTDSYGLAPEQAIPMLLDVIGNTELLAEMRAQGVLLLAVYDPVEIIDPLVAMLAAEEPLVLVAVIESLPHAAQELATPDLENLRNHLVPEVQAAARARLAEFEAFDP